MDHLLALTDYLLDEAGVRGADFHLSDAHGERRVEQERMGEFELAVCQLRSSGAAADALMRLRCDVAPADDTPTIQGPREVTRFDDGTPRGATGFRFLFDTIAESIGFDCRAVLQNDQCVHISRMEAIVKSPGKRGVVEDLLDYFAIHRQPSVVFEASDVDVEGWSKLDLRRCHLPLLFVKPAPPSAAILFDALARLVFEWGLRPVGNFSEPSIDRERLRVAAMGYRLKFYSERAGEIVDKIYSLRHTFRHVPVSMLKVASERVQNERALETDDLKIGEEFYVYDFKTGASQLVKLTGRKKQETSLIPTGLKRREADAYRNHRKGWLQMMGSHAPKERYSLIVTGDNIQGITTPVAEGNLLKHPFTILRGGLFCHEGRHRPKDLKTCLVMMMQFANPDGGFVELLRTIHPPRETPDGVKIILPHSVHLALDVEHLAGLAVAKVDGELHVLDRPCERARVEAFRFQIEPHGTSHVTLDQARSGHDKEEYMAVTLRAGFGWKRPREYPASSGLAKKKIGTFHIPHHRLVHGFQTRGTDAQKRLWFRIQAIGELCFRRTGRFLIDECKRIAKDCTGGDDIDMKLFLGVSETMSLECTYVDGLLAAGNNKVASKILERFVDLELPDAVASCVYSRFASKRIDDLEALVGGLEGAIVEAERKEASRKPMGYRPASCGAAGVKLLFSPGLHDHIVPAVASALKSGCGVVAREIKRLNVNLREHLPQPSC